jgi:hypothetical protein
MQKSCACNFLYGQKTDVHHRDAISKSLEQKLELKLEVILYKSSGEYWSRPGPWIRVARLPAT